VNAVVCAKADKLPKTKIKIAAEILINFIFNFS